MTLKSLAKGIATLAGAAAVAGAVTAGVTSASWGVTASSPQCSRWCSACRCHSIRPPTCRPDQLYGVLNGLADPGVPFRAKGYLVEGGIGVIEGRTADAMMRNASAKGMLPLSFQVSDISPVGPGAASANVTASGPGLPPQTQNVTFVDQGGWKLSRASASQVLQLFSA